MELSDIAGTGDSFYTLPSGISFAIGFASGVLRASIGKLDDYGLIESTRLSRKITPRAFNALSLGMSAFTTYFIAQENSSYATNMASAAVGDYIGGKVARFFFRRHERLERKLEIEYDLFDANSDSLAFEPVESHDTNEFSIDLRKIYTNSEIINLSRRDIDMGASRRLHRYNLMHRN